MLLIAIEPERALLVIQNVLGAFQLYRERFPMAREIEEHLLDAVVRCGRRKLKTARRALAAFSRIAGHVTPLNEVHSPTRVNA